MLLRKLRDYQLEAVAKARPHAGFAFWLEQRTGKCLTSLALVNERKPRLLLIVTLKKGKRVWEEEIRKSLKIDWNCEVLIEHYQGLHITRAKIRKKLRSLGSKGLFVIADESHLIKKRGSRPGRLLRSLGKLAQWRLALTGTPLAPRSRAKRGKVTVTKGLEDAWSQFDFIDPKIFGNQKDFEERYLKKGGFRGYQVVGYKNTREFYRIFHEHSYRRTLREVQKQPTKIKRTKIYFELTGDTRRIYRQMERNMFVDVKGHRITIPVVVARTTKLQQIASGFIKDTEAEQIRRFGYEKYFALERLLRQLFSQDHGKKVVICAKFISELDLIERRLPRLGLSSQVIKGGVDFDGKFDKDITLVQIQSGVAIDLSQADTFIFYSLSHNHIHYEQAKFRILSFDKRQANFYYLVGKGTIEELVYEAVTRKKSLASLVLDHYRRKQ
jgi:SNF2 family DNA or RNA helicase